MGLLYHILLCSLWTIINGVTLYVDKADETPTLRCALPPNEPHLRFQRSPDGSRLFFNCDRGRKTLGSNYVTCDHGQWSAPPPVCIGNGCPMTYSIQNGRVSLGYGGALVRFQCDSDYKMEGSPVLVCDGKQWNGTIPHCVDPFGRGNRISSAVSSSVKTHSDWLQEADYSCIKSKSYIRPPDIENAQSTIKWAVTDGKPRLYTTFRCKWGFVARGRSKHMYCQNGKWIGGLPKCSITTTTAAPVLAKDQSDPTKMTHEDWLMLSDYTCIGSVDNPQRIQPTQLSDGQYVLQYAVSQGMPRLFAQFRCNQGFSFSDGSDGYMYMYCSQKSWMGQQPRCVNKDDILPETLCRVNNGGCDHYCNNRGGRTTCSCREGYTLNTDGRTCVGRYRRMPVG